MESVLQLLFTDPVIGLIKGLLVIGVVLQIVPLLIYLERKLSAYMQGRLGPNRVNFVVPYAVPGLGGLRLVPGSLQPLADAIKLAFKEEIIPKDADKLLWYLGPFLAFFPIATALAFIPFGINHWDALGSGVIVDLRVCSVPISVLLLFAKGATLETVHMPGGTIPPHDGAGRLHVAFAVGDAELTDWEARLAQAGVEIEGRAAWPRGGRSIYFRDPDGHLVEFATPGLWPTY